MPGKDSELEEARKKVQSLEREKAELAEKSKGLAEIIESLSSEKDASGIEGAIGGRLKEMGEQIEARIKKVESSSSEGKDEMRRQVASLMKEKVDPKLSEISDKLKDLDKMKDFSDKLAQISEKLSSPLYQPKQPGAVSQGLASFGEQIDFESELSEVKKTLDTMGISIASMSKKVEYRLSSAEEKLKDLEKLKAIEQMYREINDKLGAENVQKLKKVIFSAEELTDEIIPEMVGRKVRKRVEPVINSLKANRELTGQLDRKVSLLEGDIKELKKFRDTINELRLEKDKLYKKFSDEEARFLQGLEILKLNIRKRIEKMMEKYQEQLARMQDFASPKTIETAVKDVVRGVWDSRIQDIEKHLVLIDDRERSLVEKDRELADMIQEAEAPENVRRWIDQKTREMERKFYYDLQGLKKETGKSVDYISALKERQKSYEKELADIAKKMSDQVSTINKVIDLKDVFAKRTEGLAADLKGLDSRIAAERERTIVLEQGLRDAESRFQKVSVDIEGVRKIISEIKPLREKLAQAEASLRAAQKKLADEESLAAQIRKMEADMESLRDRQSALEAQNAAYKARLESVLNQSVAERKHVEERIKRERLKVNELLRELKS